MYTLIAAAIRVLPERRPQTHHSSFTRFPGGARPPATSANAAWSASDIGRANVARNTDSQHDHEATSPSPLPSKL